MLFTTSIVAVPAALLEPSEAWNPKLSLPTKSWFGVYVTVALLPPAPITAPSVPFEGADVTENDRFWAPVATMDTWIAVFLAVVTFGFTTLTVPVGPPLVGFALSPQAKRANEERRIRPGSEEMRRFAIVCARR